MRRIVLCALSGLLLSCTSAPVQEPEVRDDPRRADAGHFAPDAGPDPAPDAGFDAGFDAGPGPSDAGAPVEDAGSSDAGPPHTKRTWPPERTGYSNPIIGENARPGDARWQVFAQKSRTGELEGYADRVSAVAGDSVQLHASADGPHAATWILYRIGWYAGAGARVVSRGDFAVSTQPPCPVEADTGRIRCAWLPSATIPLPPDAVSGLHLVKLVRDDGYGSWVPLVVRDRRPADLLFQASTTTWQAYNDWGGASLYRDRTGTLPRGKAVEISFDRPYSEGFGAAQVVKWEVHLARWLERHGYDVSYTDNTHVATAGRDGLTRTGAFLSVGHDEYWSKASFDAVEGARDAGVPLLFFSANTAYWQVRLGDDGGLGPRTITAWKEAWREDPVQGAEVTSKFREGANRPENKLLGIMFSTWQHLRFPLVVEDAAHFLFRGTGLHAGDAVPWLVGYESDRRFANGAEPASLQVAARVPVVGVEGTTSWAETTSYRAPSGALVFATGTIEWTNGLGGLGAVDSRVERMTANIFHEALGLPVPLGLALVPAPEPAIVGPFAQSVSTLTGGLGGPTSVAVLADGSLAVADTANHRILHVAAAPLRTVTLLAGASRGRNGWETETPWNQAQFNAPAGLLALADGSLVVADTGNHCLRRIVFEPETRVVPLAGECGESGAEDGEGSLARFAYPMGLAFDPAAGAIVVADSWNHRVRSVDPASGLVTTRAGSVNGTRDGPVSQALLSYPTAVAVDASGAIYVACSGSFTVARLEADPAGELVTLAGGTAGEADGSGNRAGLGPQAGLVWTGDALLVSDAANGRIRRLVPGTDAGSTAVSTFAGSGRRSEHDGPAFEAGFGLPLGLALDGAGALHVADAAFGSVRIVLP